MDRQEHCRKSCPFDDSGEVAPGTAGIVPCGGVMTETEQAQALLNYLLANVLRRRDIHLTADSSLVASGLIDSFALVDVLVKLEEVSEMRIPAGKVQPKDMDTVKLMLAMAKRVGKPRKPKRYP